MQSHYPKQDLTFPEIIADDTLADLCNLMQLPGSVLPQLSWGLIDMHCRYFSDRVGGMLEVAMVTGCCYSNGDPQSV